MTEITYEPDKERIFELVRTIDEDITFEEVSSIIDSCLGGEMTTSGKDSLNDHPLIRQAKQIIQQKRFDDDLQMIKREYPEEKALSVWEFGEPFLSLVMTGLVDALTAYEAYMAHKKRHERTKPPYLGGVSENYPKKEFYTPDEVDRLPKEALEDERIMEKIRNSMLRWK